VTTPIGIPGIRSKDPAAIAVSVAARIMQLVEEAAAVR
jgi:xanthine/CO dehydrogenase XdhC/CoxF family maturation factor